ncbi:MAG: addiction module protein [Candidatus Hydrogenedentes bacterium]|nr:addiction module protein [Candidatus Hydrogenedentota bacterium]
MSTQEIIEELQSLPVEERLLVADSLLRGLNPPNIEIERASLALAKQRLAEVHAGHSRPIPAEEVFARIRKRFNE